MPEEVKEELVSKDIIEDNNDLVEDNNEITMEDFFQTTLEDLDKFNDIAWTKGKGYALPNFKSIEEKLEGLEEGLYLFAAESNVGKSALMMNMLYDACLNKDNNLYGIYYSLDDSKFEIIPRVIAMDQSIPISAVSKPSRYQALIDEADEYSYIYEDFLKKREEGLQKLKDCNNLFKIEDSSKIRNANDLYQHMKKVQVYVKALDPNANIIVAIDSINDIKLEGSHSSTADKHAEIARTVKEWTVELRIPIFASTHLRKLNANRRPTLDDLKESTEYVYEASVVWMLFNDVSKNKQNAKIYHNEEGYEEKRPIMEIDWAKNKKSSYKGRSYGYFAPEYSKIVECGQDAAKRFDALVYEG